MLSANARREEIYHLAVTTGLASVEELSARFEVTASTIRRDLALLNGQGRLARTYGGARPWARTRRRRCGSAPARRSSQSTPSLAGRRP